MKSPTRKRINQIAMHFSRVAYESKRDELLREATRLANEGWDATEYLDTMERQTLAVAMKGAA